MVTHMYKYGHYVFKQSFKDLLLYFCLSNGTFLLMCFFMQYMIQNDEIDPSTWNNIVAWIANIVSILDIAHILYAISILTLKGNKDMIMELSKLDYLLVVSIFQ